MSPKPSQTPAELAASLLSGAIAGATIERGNEDLANADDAHPGALDAALLALMDREADRSVQHLRRAVRLCAEPVADGRAQAQRTRLLSTAAGALALLEQTDYRGPDRRAGTDRRHVGASPAGEALEQRRSGEDRRNPLRDALFKAGNDAWDVQAEAAYKLLPLLSVCEFAARARHSLTAFEVRALHDKPLMDRLSSIDQEWRTAIDEPVTDLHLAQCIGMARTMAQHLAEAVDGISERAYEACEMEAKQERGREAEEYQDVARERFRREPEQDAAARSDSAGQEGGR